MPYLKWKEITIDDFTDDNINNLYNEGFIFTRPGKGVMNQTRSLRIDLNKFELSSENRRILRKSSEFGVRSSELPYKNYNWKIGKMAKDFYTAKFGDGTFSANKAKELLTTDKSNFNKILIYSELKTPNSEPIGYCIVRETNKILHYSYPFYELRTPNSELKNIGMGMMLQAITWAKEHGKQYIYLGSYQRPGDKYKLQFKGLEWFDGEKWSDNLKKLKETI